MPDKAKYQMILWDFDGTLADSQQDVWESLRYAAGELEGRFRSGFDQEPLNLALPMGEILKAVRPYPGPHQLGTFDDLVANHYRSVNGFPRTVLYRGIQSLLRELKAAGVANHIVSLKPADALGRLLSNKGWDQEFDGWDSPDLFREETRTKATMVADAIRKAQIERSACVLVGDSVADWEAARANGLDFVGVTYGDGAVYGLAAQRQTTLVGTTSELREVLLKKE